MKNFILCLLTFFSFVTHSQFNFEIQSTDDYIVNITITPIEVITNNNSGGYNYNINFDYTIEYSGSNIPSSMWTLQGNWPCLIGSSNSNDNFFNLPNNTVNTNSNSTTQGNIWVQDTLYNDYHYNNIDYLKLGCNCVELIIQGPGINDGILLTIENCIESLPIELKGFTANYVENRRYSILEWTTASELNNDYFEILKSTDGINWILLDTIKGNGTTTQESRYRYIDYNLKISEIVYYKLRQVDFDGASETFGPISLQVIIDEIILYPNPVEKFLFINFNNENHQSGFIKITDILGKDVYFEETQFNPGINSKMINVIDFKENSIYLIHIKIGEKIKILKFIKR